MTKSSSGATNTVKRISSSLLEASHDDRNRSGRSRQPVLCAVGGGRSGHIETGTHSPWVSRLLTKLGHEVIVANTRKLRLIYENRRKDERIDARSLARIARLDPELLGVVQHRSETAQARLELIRARDVLVTMRTRLANRVRGAVKPFGVRLPRCSPSPAATKSRSVIPSCLLPALTPLLETIKTLSAQIRDYDRRIERLADDEYSESRALRQVSGVGALTAMAFMLTSVTKDDSSEAAKSVRGWASRDAAAAVSSDSSAFRSDVQQVAN